MKKLDFELRTAATSTASGSALENAHRVMEEHKDVLHTSGVVGTWIGAVASQAYIMVALNQGNSERLRKMIPDSIEGVSVYYIGGTPTG